MNDETNECQGSDEEYSSIIDTGQGNTNQQELIKEHLQESFMTEHVQNGTSCSQVDASSSGSVVYDRSRSHSQTKSPESNSFTSSLPREIENKIIQPNESKPIDPDYSLSPQQTCTNYCDGNQYIGEQFSQKVENAKVSEAPDLRTTDQMNQFAQLSNSSEFTTNQTESNSPGRLVIDAVPSMNSKTNDLITDLHRHMGSLAMEDNSYSQVRNYSSTHYEQSRMNQNNNTSSAESHRSHATMQFNTSPSFASMPSAAYAQPAYASPPRSDRSSPSRKLLTSSVHIGSHVISADSGPSLTVLLRRPTSERQWGFTFHGGSEFGCPPFINKVSANSLGQKFGLEVGDVIVSICNALTVGKTNEQLRAEVLRAGNELDLVLIRRGVDVEKIAQIAPFALPATPRSAPINYGSKVQNVFDFSETRKVPSSKTSATNIGRTFRNVQTKSLQILEKQLSSGETPSSVLKTKQHFQGARGLSASGSSSSFATVYGQSPAPGYSGREVREPVQQANSTTVQCNIRPISPKPIGTSYSTNLVTNYSTSQKTNTSQWSQNRPQWDDPNVNWVTAIPSTQYNYESANTQQTCQTVVYPSQTKFPDEMTVSKHSISPVGNPVHGTQTWIGRTN